LITPADPKQKMFTAQGKLGVSISLAQQRKQPLLNKGKDNNMAHHCNFNLKQRLNNSKEPNHMKNK
jgi:hypothetical protein